MVNKQYAHAIDYLAGYSIYIITTKSPISLITEESFRKKSKHHSKFKYQL